jgi:hypothetical protein
LLSLSYGLAVSGCLSRHAINLVTCYVRLIA